MLLEDHHEQLYRFLFHLHMAYLAAHPIGKKSTLTSTHGAPMLTQLPKRAALVRSGGEVGVIYTDDTVPHVEANELQQRLYLIRSQPRQKYCRPKDQPKASLVRHLTLNHHQSQGDQSRKRCNALGEPKSSANNFYFTALEKPLEPRGPRSGWCWYKPYEEDRLILLLADASA
jgi:hypothetical protein